MSDDAKPHSEGVFEGWVPFLRQWRIGALVAVVTFVGACALILSFDPVYKAYSQLVLPIKMVEDPANRKNNMPLQADVIVVRSYSDIIQDDGIARKVIADLHLADNAEFQPAPNWFSRALGAISSLLGDTTQTNADFDAKELTADRVLQDYEGRLKVVNESKALTIVLSFQARDPHLAQKIVDAHARAFVQSEIDYRRRDAAAKVAWMKNELDRSAAEARDAQVALQLNPTANSFAKDVSASAVSALKMRQLQATATQAVYDSVLKRYQDMVADQAYQGSEIRILSSATVPTHPYFPKKLLFASVAAVMSALLGGLAAAIASMARTKIDIADLAATCGLPVIGRINVPSLPLIEGQGSRLKKSLFWKQMHDLRSTMHISDRRHPVILVTSVFPKEGKSLVASALARVLASSSIRTVLIDVNGRNSRYASSVDARHHSSVGLQDFLEGSATAAQAVAKVDAATPLFLMSESTKEPTDLSRLSSSKLKTRLGLLRKEFEAIIIDTAAIESLSDALHIAGLADEIILAGSSDYADADAMKEALAKLRARAAQLKGLVIVEPRSPRSGDLARIAGYPALPYQRNEIWPKAPKSQGYLGRLLKKAFGRGQHVREQAEVST